MHTYIAARFLKAPAGRMFDPAADDDVLVARVANRDKHALELLYDKHAPAALGVAIRMVGERGTAEEIVQEAFWRVWKRAGTYNAERGKFTAWLFGIVHNLTIDELRRRRSHGNSTSIALEGETVAEMADTREDVAESALQQVTGADVRAALTALPDSQRSVIELAHFDGLTHQEIADKLGEPVGTIHTRARLALQKLREQLRPLIVDDVNL
jgi:RNA polymerase sigma-70 factor (ECF subfamily)